MLKNKTKIVATIGPACSSKEGLQSLINEGMNVARLNFSHGKHEDHEKVIHAVRELDGEMKSHTAILADLSGPKLRVGELAEAEVELVNGAEFRLTPEDVVGTAERVMVSYPPLLEDVKPGEKILLDDGKLHIEVTIFGRSTPVEVEYWQVEKSN